MFIAGRDGLAGDGYTIADMAFWGWARAVPFVLGEDAWTQLPNAKRLFDRIAARPAAARAEALKEAYAFKDRLDEETRAAMYRHAMR